jgi:hypothetical protein
MQERTQTIDRNIIRLIEATIKDRMRPFEPNGLEIWAGEDHDGDPVIFIDVRYGLRDEAVNAQTTAALPSFLRDLLWQAGERRFPHIRHQFDEKQKLSAPGRARS